MMKLKKLYLLLLSGVLCVTLYGCAGGNSSSNQENVKTELADAINQFYGSTFESGDWTVEISDVSMLNPDLVNQNVIEGIAGYKNADGSEAMLLQGTSDYIYEMKKDDSGKVTDYKILKGIYATTFTYADGTTTTENIYMPGDGFEYVESGSRKLKQAYMAQFNSFAYEPLNIDTMKNISLKKDGSQKVFNYDFELNLVNAAALFYDVRRASDIVLEKFNGELILNEDGSTKSTINIVYKDKNTGATLKHTSVYSGLTSAPEMKFPDDLSSYADLKA